MDVGTQEEVYLSCGSSGEVVVLSTANHSVVGFIPVGQSPLGLAFDNATHQVFVANSGSNNVSVIAVSNRTVVRSIAVGLRPMEVTYDAGRRELLVRNAPSNNVSIISDSNDSVVATVAIGGAGPGAVYVASRGEVCFPDYALGHPQGVVSIVSDLSNSVVARIPVGVDPNWAVLDNRTDELFVSNSGSNNVSVIDLANRTVVASIPVGQSPGELAYDWRSRTIDVSNWQSDNVSVISDTTHRVVATVAVGSGPTGVFYDNRSGDTYVANSNGTTLSVLRGSGASATNRSVGAGPAWLGASSQLAEVVVADGRSNQVTILSDSNGSTVATVSVGQSPTGVSFVPATNETWVSDGPQSTVLVTVAPTPGITGRISVAALPSAMVADPTTREVYVALSDSNAVAVYSAASRLLVATVPVGADPVALGYDNRTGEVYVANFQSGNVSVISDSNHSVVATARTGASPDALAVRASSHEVYVGAWGSDQLTVLSDANHTVTGRISVGQSVTALADGGGRAEVYAGGWDAGNISVISVTTHRAVASIPLGSSPTALAFHSGHDELVAATVADAVDVVSAANRTVLSTIPVGQSPDDLSIDPRGGVLDVANRGSGTVSIITGWQEPSLYPVTFDEIGLPAGTVWSVSFDGRVNSSSGAPIGFPGVPNGSYAYRVGPVPGYHTGWTGNLSVQGAGPPVAIVFSRTVYAVTFEETGLPAATPWRVTLGVTASLSVVPYLRFLNVSNGTYNWSIGPIPGFRTDWKGSIDMVGQYQDVLVPFHATVFTVTFVASGLRAGITWAATLGGLATSSAGPSITFSNIANGSYPWAIDPIPGYVTIWGGTVVVNGSASVTQVHFSLATYPVVFREQGLAQGTNWSVAIGGSVDWSTSDEIVVGEPNGTYGYRLSPATATTGETGTVSVIGTAVVVNVSFAPGATEAGSSALTVGLVGLGGMGLATALWLLYRRRPSAPEALPAESSTLDS